MHYVGNDCALWFKNASVVWGIAVLGMDDSIQSKESRGIRGDFGPNTTQETFIHVHNSPP